MMEYKKIIDKDIPAALELVWRTFLRFEAKDYQIEGINEFRRSIYAEEWLKNKTFFGAYDNGRVIGAIAIHNCNHIALFFVDESYQGRKIGSTLYRYMLEAIHPSKLTVNSSPFALDIYSHLGFKQLGELQIVNGLQFYAMENDLVD